MLSLQACHARSRMQIGGAGRVPGEVHPVRLPGRLHLSLEIAVALATSRSCFDRACSEPVEALSTNGISWSHSMGEALCKPFALSPSTLLRTGSVEGQPTFPDPDCGFLAELSFGWAGAFREISRLPCRCPERGPIYARSPSRNHLVKSCMH